MLNRFLYKSYRFFFAVSEWRRKRLTRAGLLGLCGLVIAGGIGVDTFQSMTYQGFTFLLALMGWALIISRFQRINVVVSRELPRFGTVGETLTYRICLKNPAPKPQSDLSLLEKLEDPRPTFEDFLSHPEPGEFKRNRWDRRTMYYRWVWLLDQNCKAVFKPVELPILPPGGVVEKELELTPRKRGVIYFNGMDVLQPDALGLYNSLKPITFRQKMTILPRRYPIPEFNLPGNRKHQPGGVAMASSVGNAEEVTALREYRAGDPMRRIHWKSWAKIGKPVVKEYQDEYFVRHALILDTFSTTDQADQFEEAVSVAASLACTIQTQESLLDLMFIGDQTYCFSAGRSLAATDTLLEILASVQPCADIPFSTLSAAVAQHAARLSGCIIILLQWTRDRQEFIRHLRAIGLPLNVLLINASDMDEVTADDVLEPVIAPDVHVLRVGTIQQDLAAI